MNNYGYMLQLFMQLRLALHMHTNCLNHDWAMYRRRFFFFLLFRFVSLEYTSLLFVYALIVLCISLRTLRRAFKKIKRDRLTNYHGIALTLHMIAVAKQKHSFVYNSMEFST